MTELHTFITRIRSSTVLVALGLAMLAGCASKPALRETGFLSDYSRLEYVSEGRMRYQAPGLEQYSAVIVDPTLASFKEGALSKQERAEVLRYLHEQVEDAIVQGGWKIAAEPGVGVGRLRIAITGIAESVWWQKVHPVSRVAGAGTGGASMETEFIDSITGEQIVAAIQSSTGSQFDLSFSTLDDVKEAIDVWTDQLVETIRSLESER